MTSCRGIMETPIRTFGSTVNIVPPPPTASSHSLSCAPASTQHYDHFHKAREAFCRCLLYTSQLYLCGSSLHQQVLAPPLKVVDPPSQVGISYRWYISAQNLPKNQLPNIVLQHQQPTTRRKRRYEDIERIYLCGHQGCTKAYGRLNHLNKHIKAKNHGQKRTANGRFHGILCIEPPYLYRLLEFQKMRDAQKAKKILASSKESIMFHQQSCSTEGIFGFPLVRKSESSVSDAYHL
ncbi:hypothetical protein BX600DRAFT_440188 [Xylariales sp. PMI_506]|nr:hypothetical protein BX600DRAFT_440188 [Xylariales sp. PMI_506]